MNGRIVSQFGFFLLGVCATLGPVTLAYGKAIRDPGVHIVADSVVADNDVIPNPLQDYNGSGAGAVFPIPMKAIKDPGVHITALDGQVPQLTAGGDWTVDSFFDITYRIDFQVNDGPVMEAIGTGNAHVVGTAPGGVEPRVFDMEMLEMNLSGEIDPTTPFLLRESPTESSTGVTTLTSLGGGQYQIDSFFDIFTELSLDGGNTWTPAVAQVPEPSTFVLMTLAGLSALFLRRRR
jgi:PEP-CTERM motif